MISLPVLLGFVATLLLTWYYRRVKEWERRRAGLKEIQGPKGFPLIGNLISPKDLHLQLFKLSEEFEDIFKLEMGPLYTVIVSNPKMAKEMLNDSNYTGRPLFPNLAMYENERLGIVFSNGEMWETHRRFLLRHLKDFGFGTTTMENLILDEVRQVLEIFKEKEGEPVANIKRTLEVALVNLLWIALSQQRFSHDDPKLIALVENTYKITMQFSRERLHLLAPWKRHISLPWSRCKIRKLVEENRAWFEDSVEEHKRTFDDENIRYWKNFIDTYLVEVMHTRDPSSVFYGDLAERQLVATLADFLLAGSATTSTTLTWATHYLCRFPHVQEKLQEEINEITDGNSRPVHLADRSKMPYTLAVIDEVLRFSSVLPNGMLHCALADKSFQGYFIPKDAIIMINLYHMHHSKKVWGDPERFRPERFLSKDGKTRVKSDNLFPFQMGRRQCIGETLARDIIFLFLTNIYQAFSIKFDQSLFKEPGLKTEANFILQPAPFSVIMKNRFED